MEGLWVAICLMLTFLTDSTEGLRCNSCAAEDTCELMVTRYPDRVGKCNVKDGKCFIRKDPNQLIYWGCIDKKFWPGVHWRFLDGCYEDRERGWEEYGVRLPIIWCFCHEPDDCNVSIELLNRTRTTTALPTTTPMPEITTDDPGDGNAGGPSVSCEVDGRRLCEHICSVEEDTVRCSCMEGFALNDDGRTCGDVDECSFQNGRCEQACFNTEGSFYCLCGAGYRLQDGKTCSDHDECTMGEDECSHICVNTPGGYDCDCPKGYQLDEDGRTCIDYNECRADTSRCEDVCRNTAGAYECACRTGYVLNADGRSCDDDNECARDNAGCKQVCQNTNGSYLCHCRTGYQLNRDKHTCSDVNECVTGNHTCRHRCVNTAGSYKCTCDKGYIINVDGSTCDDFDECLNANGGCNQTCTNIPGGFLCGCGNGFILNSDGTSCDDINECLQDEGGCEEICTNIYGSYRCSCRTGYNLNVDGKSCDDMNDCSINNGNCDHICRNVRGGRECACNRGYQLNMDLQTCGDINECQRPNQGGCNQNCVNTLGSYSCSCQGGYQLNVDGRFCDDVNECLTNNGDCDQRCLNTRGSYNCGCNPGYKLEGNVTCIDVDECQISNGGCDQRCSNTAGSFVCSCDRDLYELAFDDRTCQVRCPEDFTRPSYINSCFKVVSQRGMALSQPDAEDACQYFHEHAHLVTVDTYDKKRYLESVLSQQPQMLEGWQGWWTSAKFLSGINEFAWTLINKMIDVTDPHWGFKKVPYEDTCVWILQISVYNYTWGNYDCYTTSGYICEIDIDVMLAAYNN